MRESTIAILLPISAIALVYAAVRDHGFVWDDTLLSRALVYRKCDLTAIFTTPANTFEYLPVRDLTLCLDHALFNTWAGGFHLQNVVIFMLASILVGTLYRALFSVSTNPTLSKNAAPFALICTLIFVLHPLQVEPVSFITARNALLALLFMLATLNFYLSFLRTGHRVFYFLSMLTNALALFSKATALPTAIIVFLLQYYLAPERNIKRALLRAAPHVVITALAAVAHFTIATSRGAVGSSLSFADLIGRIPWAAFIPQFYLYKFAWPFHQSTEYVLTDVKDNMALLGLSGLLMAGVCCAILCRSFRQRGLAGLLCACFLAALLPILNLLPTYPLVADRYAQIPLVFLTPLVLLPMLQWSQKRVTLGLSVPILCLLGWLSFQQVPIWKSDETIFSHAVKMDSRSISSLENLAHASWSKGDEAEALAYFQQIAQQKPNDGQHTLFRAWFAVRQKNYDEAEELLGIAKRMSLAPYYVSLVKAEIHMGRRQKRGAIREYERALVIARKRFQLDARARVYVREIEKRLRHMNAPGH